MSPTATVVTNGIAGDDNDLRAQLMLCCRYLERLRKRTQNALLEEMDAPSVALLVAVGFADTTPLTFTRAGWKWVKSHHRLAILEMAYRRAMQGRVRA